MVSVNYANREVNCKIVYYGPGLSGKTTNLQYVHAKVPKSSRGDLISLATETDRTLYFDFLPIDLGSVGGLTTKFQLYTVPGQVFYNATRKLVLRGVDGVVFVGDSQRSKRDENIESFSNLRDNLTEYGYDIKALPLVLQYNKCDLPDLLSIDELQSDLNWNNWPYIKAVAVTGEGVFDTLKLVTKMVLARATASTTSSDSTLSATQEPDETEVSAIQAEGSLAEVTVPVAVTERKITQVTNTSCEVASGSLAATSVECVEPPPEISKSVDPIIEQPQLAEPLSVPQQASVSTEYEEPVSDSGNQPSDSEFADTFEVPRVVAMQKSLRVKRRVKKKSKFSLFGLFARLFGRKRD